jgi:hypothetical protein
MRAPLWDPKLKRNAGKSREAKREAKKRQGYQNGAPEIGKVCGNDEKQNKNEMETSGIPSVGQVAKLRPVG